MVKSVRGRFLAGLFFALLYLQGSPCRAQESTLQSAPIPGEASELELPFSSGFQPEQPEEKAPWDWRRSLEDLPPFLKDATFKINVRSFYFSRQDGADAPSRDQEKVSWALGGSGLLKTGKLYEVFSITSQVFTSQKLYGPEDKDGALLLGPGQEGYTVLGVLNPRFEHRGGVVTLYRQRADLPYLNSQENRMTPNTFESYSLGYTGEGDKPPFQFGAGYFDKIKRRDSDDFVSMSRAAGTEDSKRGMPWAGVRLRPFDGVTAAAVNYAGIDFLNIFYGDLEFAREISGDWSLKSSVQFSEQRSIGDDLLTGRDVSVTFWGAQQALSYKGFMLRAAVTANDKGSQVRSPYGSYPGYNSSIVEDFNRAGEIAWKTGISYDFAALGLDGISAYVDFIKGNRALSEAKQALNDKQETDINIDYRAKSGLLKDFWLRLRGGFVHEDTVGTTKDFRVILNYDIPVI